MRSEEELGSGDQKSTDLLRPRPSSAPYFMGLDFGRPCESWNAIDSLPQKLERKFTCLCHTAHKIRDSHTMINMDMLKVPSTMLEPPVSLILFFQFLRHSGKVYIFI